MGITPGIPRGGVTFDQLNAALAPYLTAAIAASTYLTQANAASTYFPRTGGAISGNVSVQDLVLGGVDGPRLNRSGATIRARSNDGLSDAPFSAGPVTIPSNGSATNNGYTLVSSGGSHSLAVALNTLLINSYNRTEIRNGGTTVFDSNGGLSAIANAVPGFPRGLFVTPLALNFPGMVVRGVASQSANLHEWQNSAGTVLASIGANGTIAGQVLSVNSGSNVAATISSTSTSDTTFNLQNSSTGGRIWRLVTSGQTPTSSLPTGHFAIRDGTAGADRLVIDILGNTTVSGTIVGANSLRLTGNNPQIGTSTNDGSDNQILYVTGGGGFGPTTRGPHIGLHGLDAGTRPGNIELHAGQNGEVRIGGEQGGGHVVGLTVAANGNVTSRNIDVRNGLNAMQLLVQNRWTSDTNRETGFVRWVNDVLQVGSEKGSLGGAGRDVVLQRDGLDRFSLNSVRNFSHVPLALGNPNGDQISDAMIGVFNEIATTTRFFGVGNSARGTSITHYQDGSGTVRMTFQHRTFPLAYADRFTFDLHTGRFGIGVVPSHRLHVRGSGNTNSTFSLAVEDSDGVNWLSARDDRMFNITGSQSFNNGGNISPSAGSDTVATSQFCGLRFRSVLNLSDPLAEFFFRNSNGSRSFTSSLGSLMEFSGGYAPTSGTGTYAIARLTGIINQTGGANGITQGILVAPTLTAAADWRSFDTNVNTGFAYHSSRTAPSRLGGSLTVSGTGLFSSTYTSLESPRFIVRSQSGTPCSQLALDVLNQQGYQFVTGFADAGLQLFSRSVNGGTYDTQLFRVSRTGNWNFTGSITGSGNMGFATARVEQPLSQSMALRTFESSLSAWQEPWIGRATPTGPVIGFLGASPIGRQTLPAAATDPATTQALCNALRTLLINFGLAN